MGEPRHPATPYQIVPACKTTKHFQVERTVRVIGAKFTRAVYDLVDFLCANVRQDRTKRSHPSYVKRL